MKNKKFKLLTDRLQSVFERARFSCGIPTKLNELGLISVCRACLSDEGEMKSMFSNNNEDEDPIWRKFEQISTIEVNESDGLPPVLCIQCELRLNSAFDFQQQCHRSFATLKKYIENSLLPTSYKDEIKMEEAIVEGSYEIEINNSEDNIQEEIIEEVEVDEIVDDLPLLLRKQDVYEHEHKVYSPEVVNKAIIASKKRSDEKKECRLCGFIATNARGLSLHIAHLHKELKDRWCGVCYKEVDDLSTHIKTHAKVKSYICSFCGKCFSSQGHLTEHIRSHSKDKPFKCKECGKGFLSARHLRVHERIHTGEKPYPCPHCGRSFTQSGTLQGHIRTHTGQKPFECEVCFKKFTTSSALSVHRIKTGHVSKSTTNENKSDNKEIITEDIVTDIMVAKTENVDGITNSEEDVRKLCNICGKTFTTASKLRLHMRIHTGETPYKCTFCDKRFATRGQMVVHVRTHTGEKPHVCHVCKKGFAQSSVLNTHMKLHTGRPEVCCICQQRFCRPAELKLHMRKHTGEKPYLCNECGHAFIQRSHLMEHIKIHSEDRPYQCHHCERAFKQSSSLKSHIKIHTGQKPFQCSQCAYSCRQSYALTQHMRQHQADLPRPDRPHECVICHRTFTTVAMLTSHARAIHNALL